MKTAAKQEQMIAEKSRQSQTLARRHREVQEALASREALLDKLGAGLESIVVDTPVCALPFPPRRFSPSHLLMAHPLRLSLLCHTHTHTQVHKWRNAIRRLHEDFKTSREHASNDGGTASGSGSAAARRRRDKPDEGFAAEFHRQRNYLERSVRVLRTKAMREESKATSSTVTRLSENGLLLVEVRCLFSSSLHTGLAVAVCLL